MEPVVNEPRRRSTTVEESMDEPELIDIDDGIDEDFDEPEEATAYTPGPWDWTNEGSWPDGVSIATVGDFNIIVKDDSVGNEEADARLIANAPTLLEAAQEAYTKIGNALGTFEAVHPAIYILRGVEDYLKHVIQDATGEGA